MGLVCIQAALAPLIETIMREMSRTAAVKVVRRRRFMTRTLSLCSWSLLAEITVGPYPSAASVSVSRKHDVRNVGLLLFGNYNLPFQVIGVLILVATIGVIVLSKRQLR